MKKIINKNMQQQLAQALFGTIAVKIPLNKAGTFAAPIRATAKVVESLLKFANKRSFNLFVFASAVVLNAGVVSKAFSCTAAGGTLYCNNRYYVGVGNWTCDTATATCTNNRGEKVTYNSNTGKATSYTRENSNDGSVVEYTYNSNTGKATSYTRENSNDGSVYEKRTYDPTTGNRTSDTQTNSDGSGYARTYDPTTGKTTSYTQTNSDGSGKAFTYDPTTGNRTSETKTNSDGSVYEKRTYDPTTGRKTSYTQTNSDGRVDAYAYDPNTGNRTSYTLTYSDGTFDAYAYDPNTGRQKSYAYTDANGYTRTTTYDGNGAGNSNITGRTLTDSNGQPVNGTVTSGIHTYTAENGVYTGYSYTNSDGSGYEVTYDPTTGRSTSYTQTYSDGSGFAGTYDPNTGKMTSYTQTYSDGSVYEVTRDPTTGSKTSDTRTNSDGTVSEYTYDPTTGRPTSHTETNSDGSVYEVTYDPTTGGKASQTCYDAEGNPMDGISKMNDRYIIAENGKVIARIANNTNCNTSDGLSYCIGYDMVSGRCSTIIKNSSERVVGTQICKSGESCYSSGFGSGKTTSDCTTQFYSSDGKVIATYGADGQPQNAYDYDGDGNKLVYNDQCAFVEKLDADGNSIYDMEDGLSSENRRTRYTPAEAAEIIGNSDDNMIVMYFK